jgi:hypothetical protein
MTESEAIDLLYRAIRGIVEETVRDVLVTGFSPFLEDSNGQQPKRRGRPPKTAQQQPPVALPLGDAHDGQQS